MTAEYGPKSLEYTMIETPVSENWDRLSNEMRDDGWELMNASVAGECGIRGSLMICSFWRRHKPVPPITDSVDE